MLGKSELLEAIAGKNRGILASSADQQAILAEIVKLEERNPTADPVGAADLLSGDWRLLYTTSLDLLRLDRFPLSQLGAIYQCIRAETQRVYNIAEIRSSVPGLDGIVSVAAAFTPLSPQRVEVRFQRAIVGLQSLLAYQSPATFVQRLEQPKSLWAIDAKIGPSDRQAWLDVTYLDKDLRIGRGNEGSVFVLTRT